MKRKSCAPRENWQEKLESAGVTFHSEDGGYWNEEACYVFSSFEVEQLETATAELHKLCLEAIEVIIREDRFDQLRIPHTARQTIRSSWGADAPSLYGRFDFRYDGTSAPVLLEYNADTPTALIEASVAQWYWLEETNPECDQFNSLHERLIDQWKVIRRMAKSDALHLTGVRESEEDAQTVAYLQDTAQQAGFRTIPIAIVDVGWDAAAKTFVDQFNRQIEVLFKLYPWEWLVSETFGPYLLHAPVQIIEPAWKMLLSHKGILAILWELFPGHPNLAPAYFEPGQLGTSYVKKPFWSREGANIEIVDRQSGQVRDGLYGSEGYVYQAYVPLPAFDAWHPVIGSWVVGDMPAGIGIREDAGMITCDTSRFVPHCFHTERTI